MIYKVYCIIFKQVLDKIKKHCVATVMIMIPLYPAAEKIIVHAQKPSS